MVEDHRHIGELRGDLVDERRIVRIEVHLDGESEVVRGLPGTFHFRR